MYIIYIIQYIMEMQWTALLPTLIYKPETQLLEDKSLLYSVKHLFYFKSKWQTHFPLNKLAIRNYTEILAEKQWLKVFYTTWNVKTSSV